MAGKARYPEPRGRRSLLGRDGLERLEVEDGCTVGGLRRKIQEQLGVPLRSQILSKDQGLVSAPAEKGFGGRGSTQAPLHDPRSFSTCRVENRTMVFFS